MDGVCSSVYSDSISWEIFWREWDKGAEINDNWFRLQRHNPYRACCTDDYILVYWQIIGAEKNMIDIKNITKQLKLII